MSLFSAEDTAAGEAVADGVEDGETAGATAEICKDGVTALTVAADEVMAAAADIAHGLR